jgi:hypothetical protein
VFSISYPSASLSRSVQSGGIAGLFRHLSILSERIISTKHHPLNGYVRAVIAAKEIKCKTEDTLDSRGHKFFVIGDFCLSILCKQMAFLWISERK